MSFGEVINFLKIIRTTVHKDFYYNVFKIQVIFVKNGYLNKQGSLIIFTNIWIFIIYIVSQLSKKILDG